MAWQKCMSFSKCSNSEAKKLQTSDFAIKKIKGLKMISNKQNVKNEAFKVGFTLLKIELLEKFKLKINLLYKFNNQFSIQDVQNIFSFQTPFEF